MLLTHEVEMLITSRNANYYKNKGYSIPKKISDKTGLEVFDVGTKIVVAVEDLPDCSKATVCYKCDCCGAIKETTICGWRRRTNQEEGDYCHSCSAKFKLPKIMKQKYGETNAANVPSFVNKKKETNKLRYGNEWAIASEEVKQHIKQSYIQNFGVDNPMKSEEVRQKAKNTNNLKYGGNSSQCSKEIREKSIKTCLEKYGVANPYQNKSVQEKARKTLNVNGNTPSSKAEKKMVAVLKQIYSEENCTANYQEGVFTLDCLLMVDGQRIDAEYDGKYWHEKRKQKDAARNAVLLKMGYKILRILADDKDTMPDEFQIKKAIDYLIKNNHHLTFINMNN